jgi:hypothetical protein
VNRQVAEPAAARATVAAKSMTSGSGSAAFTELTVTIMPAPRSSRRGSAARVVRTAARKLFSRGR